MLQFKVWSLLHGGRLVVAKASTGSAGWPSHLGSRRHLHPRLGSRSLHSHIPDKIFPHDLLCGPRHQHSIRRCHHPWCNSDLPTSFIQLEPLNTRWLLWRSKIAGSIYWHFQPTDGRDCGGAADACAMGFADGYAKEGGLERHVWFGNHVCPFSIALFAQVSHTNIPKTSV